MGNQMGSRDMVREPSKGNEVEAEIQSVLGNLVECWGRKSVPDGRNRKCKNPEDKKHSMLEE